MPIALKDIVDQEGIPTTVGSSFLDQPAAADARVVTRLEAAGAVIIGRAGLHEFAYGFSSENDWWGPVRNPWDPSTSPGGSSGGSGAAVAARVVPIAVGTDTGGSVRVPAALCGIVGLKVTHGRVPLTGVFPLAPSLDTVGPLAATVADATAAYLAMAGHDASDPWSADRPVQPVQPEGLSGLRIGIPHPWVDRPLAPEQRAGFAAALDVLDDAGAELVHFDDDTLDPTGLTPAAHAEVATVHREWFEAGPSRYGESIRDRLATVFKVGKEEIAAAEEWRRGIVEAFERRFEALDMVMTPATPARAKPIGVDEVDAGAGPEPYRPALSWFTPLVNMAGLPGLVLPVETDQVAGLPPSIQLIGRPWSEASLLAAGLALDDLGAVAHRAPEPHRS